MKSCAIPAASRPILCSFSCCRWAASACFRLSISVQVPNQFVIAPAAPRTGTARTRCHRKLPSDARLSRCSISNTDPARLASAHALAVEFAILGKEEVVPRELAGLINGEAGVLEPLAIGILHPAFGVRHPDHLGDGLEQSLILLRHFFSRADLCSSMRWSI